MFYIRITLNMLTIDKFPESKMSDDVIILLGPIDLPWFLKSVKIQLAYIASHGAFGVQ